MLHGYALMEMLVGQQATRIQVDGDGVTVVTTVGADDTAEHLGSGDIPVLGTPRLVALMELAARSALADQLAAGETSVGTAVSIEHLAPSVSATRSRCTPGSWSGMDGAWRST